MIGPALLQKTTLQQTLTPQQIQYLKLLQLPILSLEQAVRQEIELNPFLEEIRDDGDDELLDLQQDIYAPAPDQDAKLTSKTQDDDYYGDSYISDFDYKENDNYGDNYADDFSSNDANSQVFTEDLKLNKMEENDSYDYYDYQWEDDGDYHPTTDEDKDFESFQIKEEMSVYNELINQINLLELTVEENLFAVQIIGNIDEDGYLRRELNEIITETNSTIAEHNFNIQKKQYEKSLKTDVDADINPAKKFEVSTQSLDTLKEILDAVPEIQKETTPSKRILEKFQEINFEDKILNHISSETAEKVLKIVQGLEPAGIASRNIQECLVAQLNAKNKLDSNQKLALLILTEAFVEFSKKHFQQIQKKFEITEEQIKDAFDEIKKLNPKPGGDDFLNQTNTITPDFIVRYDADIDDLIIYLNDSTIPNLRVSPTYEKIRQEARHNKSYNKETKSWIKDRYDNAKFFIQAIKQRNLTMLIIMTAIAERQRAFFMNDVKSIKPMIYKDIADDTSLDISTVCRIVNGKYVSTSIGTFELKFFFSETLPSVDGKGVSTTVIKDKIKDFIADESKKKPLSDEQLCQLLKDEGYTVARRTIAKYRETLRIPVARLRKEI